MDLIIKMAFREIEEAGFNLGTFMATYEERLTGLMKRNDKIEQGLEGIKKERKNMNEEVTKLHKELCKERSEARGVVAIYEYMKERENPVCRTSSAQDSPPWVHRPIHPKYSQVIENIKEKRNPLEEPADVPCMFFCKSMSKICNISKVMDYVSDQRWPFLQVSVNFKFTKVQ